jgi:capsular exopolysaccharide synthesis family protein
VRRFPATASELFSPGTRPALAEAYNRLRTNFEILLVGKPFAAVSVTSCAVGEGKSTVTANLAFAMASLGRTVVAVDGDLRRPALQDKFALEMGKGVTDVAAGADVSALLQKVPGSESLTVITAGESERHPTEAVSTAFPRLLDALERSDRLVLVDSPPMAVAEATLIAVMTRAVVLVVDSAKRDPAEIERALSELRQAGADVLGVVVNRVKRPTNRSSTYEYYMAADKRRRTRR